jgi:small subunit ribosomal protein S14
MVRKAMVVKQQRMMERAKAKKAEGSYEQVKHATKPKDKYKTRAYNRCKVTGRVGGYMSDFGISRCLFRELAEKGEIPGVRKSSW